jgi:conjugal transfer pilus assembly protein TraV
MPALTPAIGDSRMLNWSRRPRQRGHALVLAAACTVILTGCTTLGSMMSPYSEKFACKNSDHGQCIHPQRAYADAVAGRRSRSDPSVTRDKAMLQDAKAAATAIGRSGRRTKGQADSVYRELQGLVEAPVTPMLRPGRTVRTLILPYADRERPERLYMPRYVYSVLDSPIWVVGDYLVNPVSPASRAPILEQVREKPLDQTLPSDRPVTPEGTTDAEPEARP